MKIAYTTKDATLRFVVVDVPPDSVLVRRQTFYSKHALATLAEPEWVTTGPLEIVSKDKLSIDDDLPSNGR